MNEAKSDKIFSKSENAALTLSDCIKNHHEEMQPEDTITGVYADLLGASMSEINWHEIAEALLEDVEA